MKTIEIPVPDDADEGFKTYLIEQLPTLLEKFDLAKLQQRIDELGQK